MRLIHYSAKPVLPIISRAQIETPLSKPVGLWLSVPGDDGWKAWCEAEGFGLGSLKCEHEVELSEGANILRLCSADDLDEFTSVYGRDRLNPYPYCQIDWRAVAAKHQGIIIAPYIWPRRLDGRASNWYYGWDCASGCIWDATAIERICVRESSDA